MKCPYPLKLRHWEIWTWLFLSKSHQNNKTLCYTSYLEARCDMDRNNVDYIIQHCNNKGKQHFNYWNNKLRYNLKLHRTAKSDCCVRCVCQPLGLASIFLMAHCLSSKWHITVALKILKTMNKVKLKQVYQIDTNSK